MSFGAYATAALMRDTIETVTRDVLQRMRPQYRYAIVNSVNATTRRAMVTFAGEIVPVPVRYGSMRPSVGALVRVDGLVGDRHISDVMTGDVEIHHQHAKGRIARAQVTSSQSPITGTVEDLTGLSLTFMPHSGRLIRVEGRCNFSAVDSANPSVARLTLTDAAGNAFDQDTTALPINSTQGANATKLRVTHEFVGAGTTVTFKLRAAGAGGSGVNAFSTSIRPGVIEVFDDGSA